MSYYFLHQEKKLPSLVVYSGLVVLTFVMVFFMRTMRINTSSRASHTVLPAQVLVSNTTNASATVSFTTSEKVEAIVQYGKKGDEPSSIAFDTRDTQKPIQRTAHYMTLTNLKPNLEYIFTIRINGKIYEDPKYSFRTFGSIQTSPGHSPIFGRVVTKNLTPAQGVLAVLRLPHVKTSQVFTTVSSTDGSWMIAIPLVQDKMGNPLTLDDTTTAYIDFTDGVTTSHVVTTLSKASPLQSVVLGKDKKNSEVLGSNTQKVELKNLQIAFPKNGAVIPSRFVRFRGIARTSSTLRLTIEPIHMEAVVESNEDGVWEFQNTTALKAGEYTFNVNSEEEKASTSVSFHIGKDGETVLGEATASGTLTTTPEPTPTHTATTPTPTFVPTEEILLTVTPTSTPTPIPTSTQNNIPTAGFSNNLFIVLASSFSLLGLILLFY